MVWTAQPAWTAQGNLCRYIWSMYHKPPLYKPWLLHNYKSPGTFWPAYTVIIRRSNSYCWNIHKQLHRQNSPIKGTCPSGLFAAKNDGLFRWRPMIQQLIPKLTFYVLPTTFWHLAKEQFRKHWGKRRNCSLWASSPFTTVFLLLLIFLNLESNLFIDNLFNNNYYYYYYYYVRSKSMECCKFRRVVLCWNWIQIESWRAVPGSILF